MTVSNNHGDPSSITLVVKMPVKPEKEQEFLDAMKLFIPKVHATEKGTELYALTKHSAEPHTYVWIERYRDAAALDDHGKTPHMLEIRPLLPEWIDGNVEVQKFEQVLP